MADQNFRVKSGLEVGIGGTVISALSTGNVGLGSTRPTAKLWVEGNTYFTGILTTKGTAFIGGGTSTGTADQVLQVAGGAYISGNIGIGTTNPTAKLWVNGDGKFIGSVTSSGFYVDGNLIGSGSVTVGPIVGTSLSISGISTFSDQVKFEGNAPYNTFWDKSLGNGAFKWDADGFTPLKIYANGLVGYAEGANGFEIRVDGNNQKSLVATINQGVELYYNNSKKLETTEDGITVTGLTTTQNLSASGISTLGTVQISSGIVTATATSGVVTYYGDGSKLTGITAASGDSYLFNTGISSSFSATLVGIGTTIFTFPATAGKEYIVHSINCSNVSTGNTEVNVIGAFDFNGGERSYFAYNIPIPTGTSLEIMKQPQVLNPSDKIVMRSTDYSRVGTDNIIETYISYQEKTSTTLFGVGLGAVGLAVTDVVGIYTSSTYPSVIQSIRLANITDSGGYPVSVQITNGLTTTRLVDNLIVPKYASVELLDAPKRIEVNSIIQVQLDQGATMGVQISGSQITS